MIRVIAGRYRGRRLLIPASKEVRCTADRVKEALFQMLNDKLLDAWVLDLYAGSGSLGIEALSRGARECVFVDSSARAAAAIRTNCAALGITNFALLRMSVSRAIKRFHQGGRKFDIVLADPPYCKSGEAAGEAGKALHLMASYDILAPHATIVIEHFKREILPQISTRIAWKRYGDTSLSFFRNTPG